MSQQDKETAKKVLGFKRVPFYVMINSQGQITQLGNKVDWEQVPGILPEAVPVDEDRDLELHFETLNLNGYDFENENKENMGKHESVKTVTSSLDEPQFILEELDF